ncbi:MAG: HD domain-containing protein [Longimicrobiales bacterium]|nr:HD domain-containing protein [Longimicrobiales bacterium]
MPSHPKTIRDPLWNTIRLTPVALGVLDTPAFQRLRYIRQLGFAHLVYPGATHTRFDHALGVYHLTRTALARLHETSEAPDEVWEGEAIIPYAALLHDIGHYAYSHALEELESDRIPADHEEVSAHFFQLAPMQEALAPLGVEAVGTLHDIIRGRSILPLAGLVSGSLDLDKMEYLRRDAWFCGVPFGDVDVDRLLAGLVLLSDPTSGRWEIGVHEKAIAALESLLFAKYQMFRNVYWHHAVRAATALYKRIVDDAVAAGILDPEELLGPTDEELLYEIGRRAQEIDSPVADRLSARWIPALRNRRLPKRSLEMTAADLEGVTLADWVVSGDARERRRVEDELALGLGLHSGEVIVDFPAKSRMFSLDVLVQRRNGAVERLGAEGLPGVLDLPRVGDELYRTARVLRVYTFERREVDPGYWTDRLFAQEGVELPG